MTIFPNGYSEKTSINDNDLILIADSQDASRIKRAKKSNVLASVQTQINNLGSPDFYKYSIVRTVSSGNFSLYF